jgi:hypothetical protein
LVEPLPSAAITAIGTILNAVAHQVIFVATVAVALLQTASGLGTGIAASLLNTIIGLVQTLVTRSIQVVTQLLTALQSAAGSIFYKSFFTKYLQIIAIILRDI